MEERRQFVRLDWRLETSYKVIGSGASQYAFTGNVGGGGVSLFTKSRFDAGTLLQITVKFPNRATPMTFVASVIWCRDLGLTDESEHAQSCETGVRFVQITAEDRRFIMRAAAGRSPGSGAGWG